MFPNMDPLIPRIPGTPPRSRALRARAAAHARGAATGELAAMNQGDPQWGFLYDFLSLNMWHAPKKKEKLQLVVGNDQPLDFWRYPISADFTRGRCGFHP